MGASSVGVRGADRGRADDLVGAVARVEVRWEARGSTSMPSESDPRSSERVSPPEEELVGEMRTGATDAGTGAGAVRRGVGREAMWEGRRGEGEGVRSPGSAEVRREGVEG